MKPEIRRQTDTSETCLKRMKNDQNVFVGDLLLWIKYFFVNKIGFELSFVTEIGFYYYFIFVNNLFILTGTKMSLH